MEISFQITHHPAVAAGRGQGRAACARERSDKPLPPDGRPWHGFAIWLFCGLFLSGMAKLNVYSQKISTKPAHEKIAQTNGFIDLDRLRPALLLGRFFRNARPRPGDAAEGKLDHHQRKR
jgi:hypothetical protein